MTVQTHTWPVAQSRFPAPIHESRDSKGNSRDSDCILPNVLSSVGLPFQFSRYRPGQHSPHTLGFRLGHEIGRLLAVLSRRV